MIYLKYISSRQVFFMNNYKIYHKYEQIVSTLSSAFDISENDVNTAILRSYAVDEDETNNRLRRVFCKASRGEEITIAAIGGSITEGAAAKSYGNAGNNAREYTDALGGEKCYFERVGDWFNTQFPNTKINTINAGIGATPSFLGTFRLDQMVAIHNPDLVMVEFAVNDPGANSYLLKDEIFESYESIVRRLLEKGIAVMIIVLVNEQGNSHQKIHLELADHYNLPTISYHNAVCPDGEFICEWDKLSPDDVHPNNAGHALLGTCISNYFDNVLDSTDILTDYPLDELHTSWIYFDTFAKTHAQYAYEFQNRAKGFEFAENMPNVSGKWRGVLVSDNCDATVKLTVPKGAKRVYVQYFNSNGSFETKFLSQKTSCNTTAIGWPRAMWHRVYTGDAIVEDTEITIKTHKKGKVILQGLLVAF